MAERTAGSLRAAQELCAGMEPATSDLSPGIDNLSLSIPANKTRARVPWGPEQRGKMVGRLRAGGGWHVTRILIGGLLLSTAGLKIHQFFFDPASLAGQGGLLASKWAVIAVVEAETFVAVCLLLDLWRRRTWAATLMVFAVFSVYSATNFLAGEPCGCFGAAGASVPAWVVTIVDVAAIAALSMFRPPLIPVGEMATDMQSAALASESCNYGGRTRFIAMGSCVMLLVLLVGSTLSGVFSPSTTRKLPGVQVFEGRYAVLEPSEWTGERLPLLDFIDLGERLSIGNWFLLIYHHDCPRCRQVLAKLIALKSQHSQRSSDPNLAVVDVPPHGRRPWVPVNVAYCKLTAKISWSIPTPCWVHVVDGHVQAISKSNGSSSWLEYLHLGVWPNTVFHA